MWELDYKESWAPKIWCFWTVVLEKSLESPLVCKEIQPVHPKGDQSWIFIGRTDAETPILWPHDAKSWLICKDPDAGKYWGQEEIVGWHHGLDGHEFVWTPAVGDGQGGLVCCGSWGCNKSDTTEWLNWTDWNKYMYTQFYTQHSKGGHSGCSSVAEWINKLWSIHTLQFYSATKRNDPSTIGMSLKNISLVKEAQQKWPYIVWFHLYDTLRTRVSLETESILVVVARGWGEVGLGLTKGCGVSFGVDENILEIEVVLAQHCECTKFHWVVHVKMVRFILCGFHPSK